MILLFIPFGAMLFLNRQTKRPLPSSDEDVFALKLYFIAAKRFICLTNRTKRDKLKCNVYADMEVFK